MPNHPFYMLGKKPAEQDVRTLDWGQILKAKVSVPDAYDFDTAHTAVPMPMFANNRYGCCVISGRAHQTLRFELLEQKGTITIKDKEVVDEYLKESGGRDSGLVVLSSLKWWRNAGWRAGGKTYKIQAYAGIQVPTRGASPSASHAQVCEAIYLDAGVGFGISLPASASKQINAGQKWDVVGGRGSRPGSWGGHYVYVSGYTKDGPVCVTWGQKQAMTWAFFDKYVDEVYAIIDAVNTAKMKKAINVAVIQEFCRKIKLVDPPLNRNLVVKKKKVKAKRSKRRKKSPRS